VPGAAAFQFALAPLLFGAVFAGMGGFVLVRLVQQLLRGPRSAAWPSVQGRIEQSEVRETAGEQRLPHLRYRYQVDGQDHEGRHVDWAVRRMPREAAEALVARYPVGAAVEVFYDPAKPAIAVLEPGSDHNQRLAAILGGIAAGAFLLLGLAMIGFGVFSLFAPAGR